MKGLLLTAGLGLAIAAAPAALADNSAFDKSREFQVAAADPSQVDSYLNDSRAAASLSLPELRARVRTGQGLVRAGGIEPAKLKQIRSKMREARDELAKRGTAKAPADASQNAASDTKKPAAEQPAKTNQQQAQAQQQTGQAPAAESSAEVKTYLAAKPDLKSLDQAGLRNRVRTGRALISQGSLSRRDRRAVTEAIRAAQAELKSRSGTSANQGDQPSQQGQTQSQAGANRVMPADEQAAGFLARQSDLKSMNEAQLRRQIRAGNQVLALQGLSDANQQAVTQAVRTAERELQSRNAGSQQGQNQQDSSGGQKNSAEATTLLNDSRNSRALSDRELDQRLRQLRSVLTQRNLPVATQRTLRQKLAADRSEIRRRVASKDRPRQGDGQNQQRDKPVDRPAGFYLTDRRPPRELAPWDLRQRINRLTIVINDNNYPRARRDEYAAILAADRTELRRRYLSNRTDRLADLRRRRDRGELNIGINVNIGEPPPLVRGYPQPVYVAEADDEEIERQFVAPPVRKPARRYTVEEVVNDEEVRQTMPAVELDSVKFGFNEDFIREEALDDMDKVGDAMEKILAAHPEEIFLIEGHTDAVGSDSYNLDLSKRRAAAVSEALTTYYNIEPESLKAVGYGERYLKIPTEEEEPENRRATIRRVTPLVGEAS